MIAQSIPVQLLVIEDKARQGDDEAAHSLSGRLDEEVLVWIAAYSEDWVAVRMARSALRTRAMGFARHCA